MARGFVPDAGDIVWLEFPQQAGHEQAGYRPALGLIPPLDFFRPKADIPEVT